MRRGSWLRLIREWAIAVMMASPIIVAYYIGRTTTGWISVTAMTITVIGLLGMIGLGVYYTYGRSGDDDYYQ